jgi:DNA-binding transcriptional MerR regulator
MATKLLTVGDLVKLTGLPIHKVEYLLSSRNITPTQRAGRFRLYGPDTVERIKCEVQKMSGAQKKPEGLTREN